MMSHAIRTPLNAVIGVVSILAQDADTPPALRGHLDSIDRSSNQLLAIVNDVLDFSMLGNGTAQMALRDFDV